MSALKLPGEKCVLFYSRLGIRLSLVNRYDTEVGQLLKKKKIKEEITTLAALKLPGEKGVLFYSSRHGCL